MPLVCSSCIRTFCARDTETTKQIKHVANGRIYESPEGVCDNSSTSGKSAVGFLVLPLWVAFVVRSVACSYYLRRHKMQPMCLRCILRKRLLILVSLLHSAVPARGGFPAAWTLRSGPAWASYAYVAVMRNRSWERFHRRGELNNKVSTAFRLTTVSNWLRTFDSGPFPGRLGGCECLSSHRYY